MNAVPPRNRPLTDGHARLAWCVEDRSSSFVRCCALIATGALVTLALSGCDSSFISEGPVAICTESGTQCQLAKGPLGVCEASPCSPSEIAPCFRCTSQH